jgi:glucokinase
MGAGTNDLGGGGMAQLAGKVVAEKLQNREPVGFCSNLENAYKLTAKDVALVALDGDPTASEIIRISGEYLRRGLAVLIDVINPQCIVIGSIYARNVELFEPHIERILGEEATPSAVKVCQIKPAELGESMETLLRSV